MAMVLVLVNKLNTRDHNDRESDYQKRKSWVPSAANGTQWNTTGTPSVSGHRAVCMAGGEAVRELDSAANG